MILNNKDILFLIKLLKKHCILKKNAYNDSNPLDGFENVNDFYCHLVALCNTFLTK